MEQAKKKLPTTKRAEEKPKRNGWVRQIKLLIEFFLKHDIVSFLMDGVRV
jgi:hypothetical protein